MQLQTSLMNDDLIRSSVLPVGGPYWPLAAIRLAGFVSCRSRNASLSRLGDCYPDAFLRLAVAKGVIKIMRLRGRGVVSDYFRHRRDCLLSPECSP
jgi:hypothetical protein